jgi:Ca-activated chloride channel family protein
MKRLISRVAVSVGLLLSATAFGAGLLIPKDVSVPPLAVKSQRVAIRIKDGVAGVSVGQTFKNSTDRDLEAVYVFPLPPQAVVTDFALYVNGKRMGGELVEKEKARGLYEDIVRHLKDPGLLENMGGNLFRVSVFPVPRHGEQKIELTYSQTLDFESGLYRLVYPLRTAETASRTLEDFTVTATVISSEPIKTVYSPSHRVGITRKGEREAVLGFEEDRTTLDRDFVLFYGVSKKAFGLNLLTHADKDGERYFMMAIAPTVEPPDGVELPKDIVFVFDSSGSMAGKKIEQARQALEYCIRKLNPGDRFNVVRFSTDVEPYARELVAVDEKSRESALGFVRGIEARGGTAIQEALRMALAMKSDKARPALVVFLTDGKPTVGETDVEALLKEVRSLNGQAAGARRLFVFGVGEEVNTHLLDKLAGENGGSSCYVKPEEDIEIRVSALADRISRPVLSRPVVTVDKVTIKQVHPHPLPDLFCGDQLTVFGRYEGAGHVAIRLTGEVNGKRREYVYEDTFPEANADNEFVPRLWATRRVGYLLDEIRLRGEDPELKQEVLRLGKEFGIMTPYTSFLVTEPTADHPRVDPLPGPMRPAPGATPMFEEDARTLLKAAGGAGSSDSLRRYSVAAPKADQSTDSFKRSSGRGAVELSEAIQDYKRQEAVTDPAQAVRHVAGRVFYQIEGVWLDSRYREPMKRIVVSFAGEEYFKLLKDRPDLKPCLALGVKVIVCLDDQTAVVVE